MSSNPTTIPPSLLLLTALQTAIFLTLWTTIHHRVKTHGPLRHARRISKIHNILYSTLNIPLLLLILSCGPQNDQLARRIYHLTKTYEYLDVLIVCASGSPISTHFAVHHLTTPFLTLCRVLYNSDGWRAGAALNVFHHVAMYAHFGGLAGARKVLPVTGTVQLVVGILVEVVVIRDKLAEGRDVWPNALAMGLGLTYFCLWVGELREGKKVRRREQPGVVNTVVAPDSDTKTK